MEFLDWDGPDGFDIVPSLAIMGTSPVWVKDGRYNQVTIGEEPVPPLSIARDALDRFGKLHYLDILGIRNGEVEWNLAQAISGLEGEVWTDTGIVYSDSVIDAIMAGSDRAILSTKMINSLEEIASCLELTENLILQIDHDERIVSRDAKIRKMDPGELVEEMISFGFSEFLIVDMMEDRKRTSMELILDVIKATSGDASVYCSALELDEMTHLADNGLDGGVISISRLIEGLD